MNFKIILSLAITTFSISLTFSQQNEFGQDMSNTIRVFDASGKAFVNPNTDVAGSPFFIDGWKYGVVTSQNGNVYSKRLLRLDCENQELHYLSPDNIEMSLPAGYIKEAWFIDSTNTPPVVYNFQCGFPSIDYQNEKHLYHVLCAGKIQMLEAVRKKVMEDKNELTGEANKEYRSYQDYYLFTGSVIERLKKDKTYMLAVLKDKNNEVETFVKEKALSYKSIPDLIKVIDYYNSLFSPSAIK